MKIRAVGLLCTVFSNPLSSTVTAFFFSILLMPCFCYTVNVKKPKPEDKIPNNNGLELLPAFKKHCLIEKL